MKSCAKCSETKPLSEFYAEKRSPDGKRAQCKECDRKRVVAYKTGLTPEEWERRKAQRRASRKKPTRDWQLYRRIFYRAKGLVHSARVRAAKRGVPFDLDQHVEEIQARIENGVCEMTGEPFDLISVRSFDSPSIDRIAAGGGYTYDNIRIICYGMNCAVGTWGLDRLKQAMKRIM